MKNIHSQKIIINSILITGFGLAIIQFIYNRSLWSDEVSLALNIINKSYFELLKPLTRLQVAPILFLQIEKVFSQLLPNSEFGLRLFPLIGFCLSLFLFYKIIQATHQNYFTIIFALSLFAFNSTLIYYSNEVKQYMTDVLVLTSVYYFVLRKYKSEEYRYYFLSIVGVISIFLSNVAPIILFTTGLYLFYDMFHYKKKNIRQLIIISIVWASTFLFYYYIFIHNNPLRNDMIGYWYSKGSFLPINPLKPKFYKFLLSQGVMIFTELLKFGKIFGLILFILTLLGIGDLIRKKRIGLIILVSTPIIIHLLLSCIKQYPFDLRLILYISPCIIIICSFGFNYLANNSFAYFKRESSVLLSIFIPLTIMCSVFANGFPFERKEIKKSIEFIEQRMNKKDKIFASGYTRVPFEYYKEISFIKMDTNNIVHLGDGYVLDPLGYGYIYTSKAANYSDELSLLKGRVWVLFASSTDDDRKMKFLKDYFNSKGKRVIEEFHAEGSDVYLYDL